MLPRRRPSAAPSWPGRTRTSPRSSAPHPAVQGPASPSRRQRRPQGAKWRDRRPLAPADHAAAGASPGCCRRRSCASARCCCVGLPFEVTAESGRRIAAAVHARGRSRPGRAGVVSSVANEYAGYVRHGRGVPPPVLRGRPHPLRAGAPSGSWPRSRPPGRGPGRRGLGVRHRRRAAVGTSRSTATCRRPTGGGRRGVAARRPTSTPTRPAGRRLLGVRVARRRARRPGLARAHGAGRVAQDAGGDWVPARHRAGFRSDDQGWWLEVTHRAADDPMATATASAGTTRRFRATARTASSSSPTTANPALPPDPFD